MTAYLIAEVTEVTDPVGWEEFQTKVRPMAERYSGRYLAGGAPEVTEDDVRPLWAVVVEFPSMERARAFYDAAEYQELKALRQRVSRGNLRIVDGLPTG